MIFETGVSIPIIFNTIIRTIMMGITKNIPAFNVLFTKIILLFIVASFILNELHF
jgi:hypothetical protein